MNLPRILSAKPANDQPPPATHDPLEPLPATLPKDIEAELDAQRVCYAALTPLDAEGRARVMNWLKQVTS